MNPTDTGAGEISRYLDAVREALVDLPPGERDELLEDLPDHLAEVAAETGQPLVDRLGPPERYAAELRAAAGIAPGSGGPSRSLETVAHRLSALLSTMDVRAGALVGQPRLRDFLVLLRPAWWVLRGYLVALLVAELLDSSSQGLVPRLRGDEPAGLVLVLAFVVGSIWVGRRSVGSSLVSRRLLVIAGLLVVAFSLPVLHDIDAYARQGGAGGDGGGRSSVDPYGGVSDVFPYGPDGQPLHGVTLYDQNGDPIQIGDAWRCHTAGPDAQPAYAYPLCGVGYPLASVSPNASPSPSPSPSLSPSPSPS